MIGKIVWWDKETGTGALCGPDHEEYQITDDMIDDDSLHAKIKQGLYVNFEPNPAIEGGVGKISIAAQDDAKQDFKQKQESKKETTNRQIKEQNEPLINAPSLDDFLQSRIHHSFTVIADNLCSLGYMNSEQRIALSSAIGDALGAFRTALDSKAPWVKDVKIEPSHSNKMVFEAKSKDDDEDDDSDSEEPASASDDFDQLVSAVTMALSTLKDFMDENQDELKKDVLDPDAFDEIHDQLDQAIDYFDGEEEGDESGEGEGDDEEQEVSEARLEEKTASATIKKYEALKNKKMWTKQEILGVSHRLSDLDRGWAKENMDEELKYILHELLASFEEGHVVDISPEQTEQGINWLRKNVINTKGELRNTGMVRDAGFNEEDANIIKNFKKFELVGFKHDENSHIYTPIYRTIGQDGHHFDYSVGGGWGGASIEIDR